MRRSIKGLSAADIRTSLGTSNGPLPDDLADRIPELFNADVITTDLLGDGYLLSIGKHCVIVAAKTDSWFRQNFTIAHELAHLSEDSLCDGQLSTHGRDEASANHYAAELLLPADEVKSLDWKSITLPVLAERIWNWGVSTKNLSVRLSALDIVARPEITNELARPTRGFLRHYLRTPPGTDLITLRSDRASRRRFPTDLLSRLEAAVSNGRAPTESLAYALGVDVRKLDEEASTKASLDEDITMFEGLE